MFSVVARKPREKHFANNMNSLQQQQNRLKATDDYIKRIKLKELFQGLLHQIVVDQPQNPFEYIHKEISKIKQEMEDNNIDIGSTTFLTTRLPLVDK